MNLLLHKLSKQRYEAIVNDPPQCVLLVAPSGSGKNTILTSLANEITGANNIGRIFNIEPLEGKAFIGIEQIRDLKITLRLKSNLSRVIKIDNATLLTTDAQNSILKLIEEPPKNVCFLLGINKLSDVIDTIQSRSSIWRLVSPSQSQIKKYFDNYPPLAVEKAIAIAGMRVGLIVALLSDQQDHPLLHSIDIAKQVLAETHFDRLLRVDLLIKDMPQTLLLLEALELVCKAALENAALKGASTVKNWAKRLDYIVKAQGYLDLNIQTKVVLCHLFMVL